MTPRPTPERPHRLAPSRPTVVAVALVGATLAATLLAAQAGQTPAWRDLSNVDARDSLVQAARVGPGPAQRAAINDLRSAAPNLRVEFSEASGVTRSLWNVGGFLSLPDGRDPEIIATDFMRARTALLGLTPGDIADVELTDGVESALSGVTHLYYRQRMRGVPVFNGLLQFNIARDGRILSIVNGFVPALHDAVSSLAPALDAASALGHAAQHLGMSGIGADVTTAASGIRHTTDLAAPGLSAEPVKAALMVLPIGAGVARLVWNFQIWTLDRAHAFDYTVDAESGMVWTRIDWAAADHYRVYPRAIESPNHTTPPAPADGRVLVTDPAHPGASPFGWHDTDGVPGAEFTITRGNNVHAYTDLDADDVPDPGGAPDCRAALDCDFTLDLGVTPLSSRGASVTNLFYWTNLVHDVQHRYGFDEGAGNFQVNNYGNGGVGHDSLQAEALDGFSTNNANFVTPPEGARPRMQMFRWTATTPSRDGDFDSGIIVHEYGHGISNRLVGGPSQVSCLGNSQQPGEGISDWLALVYTAQPTDTPLQGRGIGTYTLGQPTTGQGIRTERYSTDPIVNTWTYESIAGASRPHGVGAVWAQAMWEAYWALVGHHGFDADLHDATGSAGNQRAMLYLTEGLKNTACSPTFTDARDAVIQAAQTLHNGEDVCRLWEAFAGFGLGIDAVSRGPSSTNPSNGFNVPVECGGLAPQPPTSLVAKSIENGIVTIGWAEPIEGLAPTHYVLEGGLGPGDVRESIATAGTLPTFTFAAPTGVFYLRVRTASGAEQSEPSNEIVVYVNVPAAPSAPASLLAAVNGSTLDLAWTNTFAGGVPAGLVLEVSGSATASIPLPPGERFRFDGVPQGTYLLRLRATNGAGTSAASNPVTVTLPGSCSGAPRAATNVLSYAVGSTLVLSWDPPAAGPAPTGYLIEVDGAVTARFTTTARVVSAVVNPGAYHLSVVTTNACGSSTPEPARLVALG